MTTKLSDLIPALAAATGPSRELDERLATEVFGFQYAGHGYLRAPSGMFHYCRDMPRYTLSLDAITGALEQRWPGFTRTLFYYGLQQTMAESCIVEFPVYWWNAGHPALALCLAAVRLAEREAGDG